MDLESIEQFGIPFDDDIRNWMFSDEDDNPAPKVHQDQIVILSQEAANYLWTLESQFGVEGTSKFFTNVSVYDSRFADNKAIRKYLYELGIPFKQKVFISIQPDWGLVLTWKMVIKYAHNLFFGHDIYVRDSTFNWHLYFHHDGDFRFCTDFIFDGQEEMSRNNEMIANLNKEKK